MKKLLITLLSTASISGHALDESSDLLTTDNHLKSATNTKGYISLGTTTAVWQHVGAGVRLKNHEIDTAIDISLNGYAPLLTLSPLPPLPMVEPLPLGIAPKFAYIKYLSGTNSYLGLSAEAYFLNDDKFRVFPNIGIIRGYEFENGSFSQFQINIPPAILATMSFGLALSGSDRGYIVSEQEIGIFGLKRVTPLILDYTYGF